MSGRILKRFSEIQIISQYIFSDYLKHIRASALREVKQIQIGKNQIF